LVLGQDEQNHAKADDIGDSMRKRVLVARPGWLTAPAGLICGLLASRWPTLSHFVRLKNSKPCSLTLPFFESRSSWKVENTKKKFFFPKLVKTKREGIVWKIPKINAKHDYNIS
jgi:hypothetical protein